MGLCYMAYRRWLLNSTFILEMHLNFCVCVISYHSNVINTYTYWYIVNLYQLCVKQWWRDTERALTLCFLYNLLFCPFLFLFYLNCFCFPLLWVNKCISLAYVKHFDCVWPLFENVQINTCLTNTYTNLKWWSCFQYCDIYIKVYIYIKVQ